MSAMVERVAKKIFDRGGSINWRDSQRLAREIIAEMREPAGSMVWQAAEKFEYGTSDQMREIWMAMIDEALSILSVP